jgi:xanthine dehydrogenase accessory factor
LIRGGGDLASGVAYKLMRCGIACLISELPEPLSVRRLVCFSSAIHEGTLSVEGVTARRVESIEEAWQIMAANEIPVMVDPNLIITQQMHPTVIVDGRMLKKADSSHSILSTIVIGLGPGFYAGRDCRAVIETNRGPKMGRVIWFGATEPDTGTPEQVNQYSNDRVLRAPVGGILKTFRTIPDQVETGQVIGDVEGIPIKAKFTGIVRGLLRNGSSVRAGMKIGDLDPRNNLELAKMISEKSLAIGGGVLEALLSDRELREKLLCGGNETA